MVDLKVSLRLQVGGSWVELQDPRAGYRLHSDTISSKQVTHRKTEVESEWLEGSYVQRSLRANITESVVVHVIGASAGDMMRKQRVLTRAFDQANYSMMLTLGDYTERWLCQAADYTIESSQPLLVAKRCIVRAQVPHLPKVVIS